MPSRHMPIHRTARDTDDAGTVWLRRTGFWAAPADDRPAPTLPAPVGVEPPGRGVG